MKKFDNWYFPDHEEHLPEWMTTVGDRRHGRLTYQAHKYDAAMRHVPVDRRRRAVDIGAHVGLWSWLMAFDFQHVNAFEPMPKHRACWKRNVAEDHKNVFLNNYALGAEECTVSVRTRTANSSGDTGVEPSGEGLKVQQKMLDQYAYDDVDFVKIDCEGYELFVCKGARDTLLRCKPVVIVEQKPETGGPERYGIGTTDAVKYLESLGAVKREGIQGDYVMAWPV